MSVCEKCGIPMDSVFASMFNIRPAKSNPRICSDCANEMPGRTVKHKPVKGKKRKTVKAKSTGRNAKRKSKARKSTGTRKPAQR